MAEDKPKSSAKQSAKKVPTDQRDDSAELKPSEADAPGPITPEHESGSWEQEQDRQEKQEDRK